MIVKQDRFFAVSAPDGSMRAADSQGDGVWFADTRILSEFRVLVGGVEPALQSVRNMDGWAEFELAAAGVRVSRLRYMDYGLRERITIANPESAAVETEIELVFAADFAAMLAVRGAVPDLLHGPAPITTTPEGVQATRDDGANQSTRIFIRPEGARHKVRLDPGEEFTLLVDVVPSPGPGATDFDSGLAKARAVYPRWDADSMSVHTDNPALNELLNRGLMDIRMLCDLYPTGLYPAAGLPWFAVPFGRDQLITSMQMLPANPDIARGVLRYLASNQGRRTDPFNEEEPGKILHEVRTGEVVDRGLWPNILYGTVDATPLFLCALAETVDWTGDRELFDDLWPAAEAALDWCGRDGDLDADGYIEYRGGRARNQGWKDSYDALTNTDGTEGSLPAALCEVQGYLYRGLLGMARHKPDRAAQLKARAAKLRRRFNRDFWISREKFIAQALDGSKRRVEAVTSNAGHCLWAGILARGHAAHAAARLVAPDMFSGWGVRTLSTAAINYDTRSYHNGSVWPFDSAIIAAGLRQSGFSAEAELIARALLEAGMALPWRRLPELWSGDERVAGRPPTEYWNSCSPQAWSAGAAYLLVTALLGLQADAARGRLRIAPVETALWRRIEVSGLHFAGHRIDFAAEGKRVTVGKVPAGVKITTS